MALTGASWLETRRRINGGGRPYVEVVDEFGDLQGRLYGFDPVDASSAVVVVGDEWINVHFVKCTVTVGVYEFENDPQDVLRKYGISDYATADQSMQTLAYHFTWNIIVLAPAVLEKIFDHDNFEPVGGEAIVDIDQFGITSSKLASAAARGGIVSAEFSSKLRDEFRMKMRLGTEILHPSRPLYLKDTA